MNDYEIFPLYGYDVAGQPSGEVNPGPAQGPSNLQVNGQSVGYNLPSDYAGPLLVGSPGGGDPVVLTDPGAIAAYRDEARERALEGVGRVGLVVATPFTSFSIASGSSPGASGGGYQLSQVEGGRQVGPVEPPFYGQPRPPPRSNLPVPYEPPLPPSAGAVIPGIFPIIGGIIGALWEGWPNALDPELGPYDTRAPAGSPRDETPAEGPEYGAPDVQGPPQGARGDNPMPLPFPDYGDPAGQSARPEDIGLGPTPDFGPPVPANLPAPTPAPTSPGLPPWVWPLIGGLGAIQIGRAGRSRSSQTLPELTFAPELDLAELVDLLPQPAPTPGSAIAPITNISTFVSGGSGGAFDNGQDTCNCSPKRGKKRKCLARAQLSWRSGPKKGRAAGSRCYRFED